MPAVSFSLTVQGGNAPIFAEYRRRAADLSPALREVPDVMRFGEDSVDDQWRRQTTISLTGSQPWKPTSDFGTRKAPARTLKNRGNYLAAWRGEAAGSVTRITGNSVAVGVDEKVFPQVRVFQRSGPTKQRVTRKQRFYLGMEYGVWLREGTTLTNEPRAFRVSPGMLRRGRRLLTSYVASGRVERGRAVA